MPSTAAGSIVAYGVAHTANSAHFAVYTAKQVRNPQMPLLHAAACCEAKQRQCLHRQQYQAAVWLTQNRMRLALQYRQQSNPATCPTTRGKQCNPTTRFSGTCIVCMPSRVLLLRTQWPVVAQCAQCSIVLSSVCSKAVRAPPQQPTDGDNTNLLLCDLTSTTAAACQTAACNVCNVRSAQPTILSSTCSKAVQAPQTK